MWEQYKETFDGVHASQRLKTEVLNMKREENATKRRRVPAAALVAAILAVVLAGTALAVEIYSRVEIQTVDTDEANEFGAVYIARAELPTVPLEDLTEEARERAAGMTEMEDWAFDSWSEAAEFLGLDLAENPVLDRMQKAAIKVMQPNSAFDRNAFCRAAVTIDPDAPGIPNSIYLRAAYQRGECSVLESVMIWIDYPGQNEPHDSVNTAVKGIDTFQTEAYVTPSGMEVSIVTHETESYLEFTNYTAYFVKDGLYYFVKTHGGNNALNILKEILDAYE